MRRSIEQRTTTRDDKFFGWIYMAVWDCLLLLAWSIRAELLIFCSWTSRSALFRCSHTQHVYDSDHATLFNHSSSFADIHETICHSSVLVSSEMDSRRVIKLYTRRSSLSRWLSSVCGSLSCHVSVSFPFCCCSSSSVSGSKLVVIFLKKDFIRRHSFTFLVSLLVVRSLLYFTRKKK